MRHVYLYSALLLLGITSNTQAKIDLVTLPQRDRVQLTIYNGADLTFVREQRTLTLKAGVNRLEFGWADTLIDPTSVQLTAPKHAEQVQLREVSYPPNINGSAVWTIDSKIAGAVPVEITFFTSGISWRSFYTGTLSADEQSLRLQNYVRIDNHSGEDYAEAQTRVVVGKISLLDQIADLAKRSPPYGSPVKDMHILGMLEDVAAPAAMEERSTAKKAKRENYAAAAPMMKAVAPKQIVKEGLSEYFLYSIEGTESIPNGWGKRLLSLEVADIPVKALYRHDLNRYGHDMPHRLLSFKNDKAHHLGDTPLPDGQVMIYRQLSPQQNLSYVGSMYNKYIPIEQEVELDFGTSSDVKIEPVLLEYKTNNYVFDRRGNIAGFDKLETWQLKIENSRDIPVDVEIMRHFQGGYWSLQTAPEFKGTYEKVDIDTVKYRLTLAPQSQSILNYTLTLYQGERQQRH